MEFKRVKTWLLYAIITVVIVSLTYIYIISDTNIYEIKHGIAICILSILLIAFYYVVIRNIDYKSEKNKLSLINEELKEKEALFRTVFEQSPIGIAFGNFDNEILDVNSKFEKIVGRTKEELYLLNWNRITHPDDLEEDMNNFYRFKTGEINGYSMNKRYIKPDGSIVWANITIAPFNIGNETFSKHLCIVEDITERIQSEENLRESERNKAMLLSNLPGMAYRCNYDRDWTMQFVSEGCFTLTGYKPESLILNKEISFNNIISEYYRASLWDKWTKVLNQHTVFREEYEITTASKEVKWVFEQGQGVYNEKGEVLAIEGLIIDITTQKIREDEIRHLNYHDFLTGLYNRRFFEEEKNRIDSKENLPLSIVIGDINGLKLTNDSFGHDEGDKLIITIAKILENYCPLEGVLSRTGGDEFSILLPNTSNEEAYKIIKKIETICSEYKRETKDEAIHASISLGCATKTSSEEDFKAVIKEAEDNMYRNKLLQNKSLHSSIISYMKTTMLEKSQETEEHAKRLIKLSKAVGVQMNLIDEHLNELEILSTIHDIGNIGISDNILNKPGILSEDEWLQIKKHPEIGYRIAMSTQQLTPIAIYILCHHEQWDGNGYPQGLKGDSIPLLSRIIAIVDAYDAMTHDRSYRKAMTKEDAILELKKHAGTQFDEEIVNIFIDKVLVKLEDEGELND